jgi:hypothetical protein
VHQYIVKNVELFKYLEVQEIFWIIQRLKTQVFLPQEFITQIGDTDTKLYFVTEGIVVEDTEDYRKHGNPKNPRTPKIKLNRAADTSFNQSYFGLMVESSSQKKEDPI